MYKENDMLCCAVVSILTELERTLVESLTISFVEKLKVDEETIFAPLRVTVTSKYLENNIL